MTSWTRLFFIYCQLFGIYIVFDDFNKTFTSKIQPLKETPFFFMLLSKSDESSLSNNVIVYWITHPPLGYVIQKRMSITYFPKKLVQCASSSTLRVHGNKAVQHKVLPSSLLSHYHHLPKLHCQPSLNDILAFCLKCIYITYIQLQGESILLRLFIIVRLFVGGIAPSQVSCLTMVVIFVYLTALISWVE